MFQYNLCKAVQKFKKDGQNSDSKEKGKKYNERKTHTVRDTYIQRKTHTVKGRHLR